MDILDGGQGAMNRPMNQQQQQSAMVSDQPPTAYGNDQSLSSADENEECPRYMLAGTLTC